MNIYFHSLGGSTEHLLSMVTDKPFSHGPVYRIAAIF